MRGGGCGFGLRGDGLSTCVLGLRLGTWKKWASSPKGQKDERGAHKSERPLILGI